jgi:hypothetical protein
MSEVLSVFNKEYISPENIFDFVKSFGGYIMESDNPSHNQGVVEKGDSTLWVYHSNDITFFSSEINFIEKNYGFEVLAVVQIELNSEDESRSMALDFCKGFLGKYPDALLLDDSFSKYYTLDELQKVKCTDEDIWV